jgi:hypothetical protein
VKKGLRCSRCNLPVRGAGHIVRRYGRNWWALCRACNEKQRAAAAELDDAYAEIADCERGQELIA